MKLRRVKITGIGPVTPAGIGREAFWQGILEPVSRVRAYTKIGSEYGPLVAAHLDGFEVANYVDRTKLPKGAARHSQFAAAGAALALADARVDVVELRTKKGIVVTGSTLFDFGGIGGAIDAVYQYGARAARGRVVYTTNSASVPGAICAVLELKANTMTLQSSCCSGMDAIGYAAELVANGTADFAICGGSDAPLHRFPLLELRAAGLTPLTAETPEKLARPFDMWRTTGVVSEGACMFLLEPESSPRPAYAYVDGYAYANDAPEDLCGGLNEAVRSALADAKAKLGDVESINAWGPGHKLIDQAESAAMDELFGDLLREIPVVSIKGAIGSPLGAAPAMQVASTALSLQRGVIPPTVNWEHPDPSCPLNLSGQARVLPHQLTLVNGHGLAGVNACLVLRRC